MKNKNIASIDDVKDELDLWPNQNVHSYEHDYKPEYKQEKLVALSDLKKEPNNIPVVSFFSGAGGLDLGFETAGFSHLALFEFNEIFCNTIKLNRPYWDVYGPPHSNGDVSKFDEIVDILSKKIDVDKPFNGVFIGGPPCQPFSIAANQRYNKSGDNYKRVGFAHQKNGNLLFDYIKIIIKFRPKVFMIENVSGLLELDKGEQLAAAYEELKSHGYLIEKPMIVNAANYGVPQSRKRLFVIGSLNTNGFKMPEEFLKNTPCGLVFDKSFEGLENHVTRKHSIESISRYKKLNYGSRDHLGRVDRLNPSLPSKTVIAGGTSGGGRSHLHPYVPRTLSVRESARLQTFPDNYIFTGPIARQFTQVGNAVPPVLAATFAASIFENFFKK